MPKKINIAIDGHSSCGEGTLPKNLAKELGYMFIDSGAMYRAVTLFLLQNEISLEEVEHNPSVLLDIDIDFRLDPMRGFYNTFWCSFNRFLNNHLCRGILFRASFDLHLCWRNR